jgi:hypothetical protein
MGLYLCLRMFDSFMVFLLFLFFVVMKHFVYFSVVITLGFILLCFSGPSETVRGSNFYYSWLFYYSVLPFVRL